MANTATPGKRQKRKKPETSMVAMPMPALADEHLDISALETWLWDAACAIRAATDAPKFKDFILPLTFFKRLSDVFDDGFAGQVKEFGDEDTAREVIKADHEDAPKTGRRPIVGFFIPHDYRWDAIRKPPQIHLREMRRKWASLSGVGRLTLNLELVELPKDLGEFVLVHELVHMLAPNHGKIFKSFMHAYLPDWEERETRLSATNSSRR